MIFISELQKETLLLVDNMIADNKTFKEIQDYLYDNDYIFSQYCKNGYRSKTRYTIEKISREQKEDGHTYIHYENSFVELIKRKNGLASWETWKIS